MCESQEVYLNLLLILFYMVLPWGARGMSLDFPQDLILFEGGEIPVLPQRAPKCTTLTQAQTL